MRTGGEVQYQVSLWPGDSPPYLSELPLLPKAQAQSSQVMLMQMSPGHGLPSFLAGFGSSVWLYDRVGSLLLS